MATLATVTWMVMVAVSIAVMAVAVVRWIRASRSRPSRGPEPSPVNGVALGYAALAVVAVAGVQLLRDRPIDLTQTLFTGVFIGFALSAAWYLRARRGRAETGWANAVGALVAVTFGCVSTYALG